MSSRKQQLKLEIPSDVKEIHRVEEKLEAFCRQQGMNKNQIVNCAIAVTEAVNNAIRHGNKQDPSKKVFIQFSISGNNITIRITDQGNGFDPENLDDPLHPNNLLKENGRGIFIVKQLMDDVRFEFNKTGTTIILSKTLTRE
ncbi:MAG: ATP-binding protein [candidate division KSB1 bacterium]|nr:ATP-binding protein [candidate division KSB1 bacterium]